MTIPFQVLVRTDGTRRFCTMNCGPSASDMRSRADIMRECDDCEDHEAAPPDPKERIVELELEVAYLRIALRNAVHALDAGHTKEQVRLKVAGWLRDSEKRGFREGD